MKEIIALSTGLIITGTGRKGKVKRNEDKSWGMLDQ